jgi:serine/threonine-protein kinase
VIDVMDSLQVALAGRYQVRRELGRGGMANVYLADDLKHGRSVALKVLRPELLAAIGSDRFLREIRIEGTLQHPQILPMYDSGEVNGLLYYVMPYVEGQSLRARLESEKQLPVEEAVGIAVEIAEALDYAHGMGVVHRDIKPENILLSRGHALLADFGIARALSVAGGEKLTQSGVAIGTPAYMSPEQAGGVDRVDRRTDVYALGCVLFEMLAGQPPFTGRTAQAIMARHMQERPPSLQVVRPGLSAGVIAAVEKSLAKVPADRFPTAGEFAAALASPEPALSRTRLRTAPGTGGRAAALVGAGLLVAFGVWRLAGNPGESALDPDRVMVFPFRDLGGGPAGERVGRDVATYVGHVLDGSAPLKWEEAPEQSAAASEGPSSAAALSRRHRASFYIDGTILRDADSVTVVARLLDATADSLLGSAGRSGPAGVSEARLGALAVVGLLPALLAPGRKVDVGGLADRSPAAIASFLQGEEAYRRTHFLKALEHYRRALGEDSSLALAAAKGSQAASWINSPDEAEELAGLAIRGETWLPHQYAELTRGLRHYMEGDADSAVTRFRRALAVVPGWSEAWMALGEVFYHLLPREGQLDSLAEDAFRRAARADSGFTPPLYHLAEIAVRRGDEAGAERLIRRMHRVNPDSTLTFELELMLRCTREGTEAIPWEATARRAYHEVLDVAHALATAPGHSACAKDAFRAVVANDSADDSHRFGALFGLQNVLLRERRFDEVRALLKSETGKRYGGDYFFLLDGAAVGAFDQEADDVARAQGSEYSAMATRKLWILGLWSAARGRTGEAGRIAAALRLKADSSSDSRDRLFADIVTAHASLGNRDTATALLHLEAMAPAARWNELAWSLWEPLGAERLLLAELVLERGDPGRALRIASTFDAPGPMAYLLYLPKSLAVRARAADALGREELSARYRTRLAALDGSGSGR